LQEVYNFKNINKNTKLFGITGSPLETTSSPSIHNAGFRAHAMNAVYIPIRSDSPDEAIDFANKVGVRGLSVTFPHKESILQELKQISEKTGAIGACNTIIHGDSGWQGHNTDAIGLKKALIAFTGFKSFRRKRVAIIGAGGAAKAAANVVKELKGHCCIFNRTVSRAREIAENYGFKYAFLGLESLDLLESYSDIIIQATSIGMKNKSASHEKEDPLGFYDFRGHECVYDIVYEPKKTPLLQRAEKAGCKIKNGYTMLQYQAYEQFKLFTGEDYE
ncbi:MAG TPA: shikimate dehydrogenase, partial [Treponemataceae bacterium]|nr:shikimate dehydrogenase [Treponemataceae bacterium]